MALLTDLPVELMQNVLSILAAEAPPSERYLREEPSPALLASPEHPLKDLGCTCRLLRRLSWPYLSKRLKADVEDIPDLIVFAREHELGAQIPSLLLYSIRPVEQHNGYWQMLGKAKPDYTPSYRTYIGVRDIIDLLDPSVVTFVLPPASFEDIIHYKLQLKDAWAFDIPFQVLRLEQDHFIPGMGWDSSSGHDQRQNIFGLRLWTSMTFNEGSSVRAYSTYEYFNKITPSLLTTPQEGDPLLSILNSSPRLVSFEYIAVFPMYNPSFIEMGYLRYLEHFCVQLHPTPANDILDNDLRLGTSQRSDLWSELHKSYGAWLGSLAWGVPTSLTEFTSLDFSVGSVQEIIEEKAREKGIDHLWHYIGDGQWLLKS